MTNLGLYIHIPFCEKLCSYCDFTKLFYNEKQVSDYLTILKKEFESYGILDVSSIYFGGGTPSSLNVDQLRQLLEIFKDLFKDNIDIAFEANIENLTLEKIKLLKEYGINRVSLGIQTFNQDLLKIINRKHDYEQVKKVISNLIENGINNINIDLIYGLPGEDLEILNKDLDLFLSLDVKHISTYSLTINPHTMLYNQKYKEQDEDNLSDQYNLINKRLKEYNFIRYETSNFAKPGYESKHNLIYWRNEEYIGLGLGASSYFNNERYTNTSNLNKYLNGNYDREVTKLSLKDKLIYQFITSLRLKEGLDLSLLDTEYKDVSEPYKAKIKTLINKNLVEIKENRLVVKDEYFYILDRILIDLI